jgi:hypothetical protein
VKGADADHGDVHEHHEGVLVSKQRLQGREAHHGPKQEPEALIERFVGPPEPESSQVGDAEGGQDEVAGDRGHAVGMLADALSGLSQVNEEDARENVPAPTTSPLGPFAGPHVVGW